ncbi:MAG: heavy metal-associated domain-containing protein [Bacteroidota bacterium]
MKRIQQAILALVMVCTIAFSASAQKKQEEVKIKTSAICKMCKATIERQLAFTKGVEKADLDVATKVVTVAYNPKKTTVEKIKKAINESGYDADESPADPKAYNKLEECCKKDQAMH